MDIRVFEGWPGLLFLVEVDGHGETLPKVWVADTSHCDS
jgi:hypothetical protein